MIPFGESPKVTRESRVLPPRTPHLACGQALTQPAAAFSHPMGEGHLPRTEKAKNSAQ
jgi:hypothetical protein